MPVGIVCLVIGSRMLVESRDPATRRIDLPGLITSVLWLAALTYGFIERGSNSWTSGAVSGSLIAAVVLFRYSS